MCQNLGMQRSRLSVKCTVLLLSTAVLLVGCADQGEEGSAATPLQESGTSSPSPSPSLASFDPPRAFDGRPVPISLPAFAANLAGDFTSSFLLAGDRTYGTTETSVGSVDLATGEILWETPFPNAGEAQGASGFYDSQGPYAPVLGADGGTVYAATEVVVEGSGTTKDSVAVEVVGLGAESGDLLWSADIPVDGDIHTMSQRSVGIVSVEGGVAVVSGAGTIAAVDLATHEVLWVEKGGAALVTDGVVVGTADPHETDLSQLTGFDVMTGEVLWTDADSAGGGFSMFFLSSGELYLSVHPYSGADDFAETLDVRTGVASPAEVLIYGAPYTDGDLLYDVGSDWFRSIDQDPHGVVWELPTDDRTAPRNPFFFGGLVYGTANGQGVILDGETGEDVAADIPGSFVNVNEYGALMLIDHELYFVPATA